jgi:hypothetical protein
MYCRLLESDASVDGSDAIFAFIVVVHLVNKVTHSLVHLFKSLLKHWLSPKLHQQTAILEVQTP